jgi:hypothetical protein
MPKLLISKQHCTEIQKHEVQFKLEVQKIIVKTANSKVLQYGTC